MSFYKYYDFIDWEKVKKCFHDENEAIKRLKEDYASYSEVKAPDGTIDIQWDFMKWIKTKTVNLDQVIKEISKNSRYNKK